MAPHSFLSFLHIVYHAPVLPGERVTIENAIGCARIGVSGLSNATGINNQALFAKVDVFVISGVRSFTLSKGRLCENDRCMGVPHKTVGSVQ